MVDLERFLVLEARKPGTLRLKRTTMEYIFVISYQIPGPS